jgi:hypothetical protein
VYAPGSAATGWSVSIVSGSAKVYAGLPGLGSHRVLATLTAGGAAYVVTGLAPVRSSVSNRRRCLATA